MGHGIELAARVSFKNVDYSALSLGMVVYWRSRAALGIVSLGDGVLYFDCPTVGVALFPLLPQSLQSLIVQYSESVFLPFGDRNHRIQNLYTLGCSVMDTAI